MAWDGTSSWEIFQDYFILTATGFDANGEAPARFHLDETISFFPSHFSMYVVRTAGLTDAVDVRLQIWDHASDSQLTILTVTDSRGGGYIKSLTIAYDGTGILSGQVLPALKIESTTVGAGNTLTVTVIGRR